MVNVFKKGGTDMQQQDIFQLQAVQEIVKKIQTLIYEEVWDLQQLEDQMRRHVLLLGQVLMVEALARLDNELGTSRCAKCGGKMHQRKRARRINTLIGSIRFKRSQGSCQSCGAVVYWLDRELGIDSYHGSSRGVKALQALCAASWGYVRSAEVVSRVLGIKTPAMSVYRNVNRSAQEAEVIEQQTQESSPVYETVQPIMVDADGVMIHSRDKVDFEEKAQRRMEGKVICVWTNKERISRKRYRLSDKRYYATFRNLEQISPSVYQDVFKRARARYPAEQVVVRGDGGSWIRTLYREWFYRGRLLLDAYHLRKKIHRRLKEALHKTDRERIHDAHRLYHLIKGGKVLTAQKQVKHLSTQTERLRDPVALRKLEAYLVRHQEGMWYPQAFAEGIDIGTGAIEKGGDLVICRRFKLRGMRWSRTGAEKVLQYRLLVLNNEWDSYWQTRRTA
jgi:hypothetical protein